MGRCLIVANQTLGGERLDRTVRERIARGDDRFFILVPRIEPHYEAPAWTLGYAIDEDRAATVAGSAFQRDVHRREARFDARSEARRRAASRLEKMMVAIHAAGGTAEGRVGDSDPTAAVKGLLETEQFDEIIISTLPTGLSRWLKMKLPRRVARMTTTPVTTIEADETT